MTKKINIKDFRDAWLDDFFEFSPPGNRYEELSGKLNGYSSVRVNKQYRLIFKWVNGKAEDLYLDPHKY